MADDKYITPINGVLVRKATGKDLFDYA